jgi:excisionase family DNA binding protein
MSQTGFFTTTEVASRLKVAPRTVGEWIRTGQLRAIKAGRDWRVSPNDLEAFLHANANRPPERVSELRDRGGDPSSVVDLDSYRKPPAALSSASQPRD